ncbi:hypothetical protein Q2K19_05330 [Micromonospora soli]|uniref:hypothetical protein n=1 Tax=Micromonospora sp. NBRC 110009 TaxID=3061627 RepID=UPI0026739567|nr:hypothetical protein [Micromonospora sp. NBRC 110009]WKT99913.1 hypothetical protein Q2K19_05330 [Micromonospora sp. NBRC 110009]
MLHEQVGRFVDTPTEVTTRQGISRWLGRREVRWQETDNPEGTKEVLVLALKPRFNRQVPKPRPLPPR